MLLVQLLLCISLAVCCGGAEDITSDIFIYRLDKLLNYTAKFLDNVNIDAILGISIAEAQLKMIPSDSVAALIQKCAFLRSFATEVARKSTTSQKLELDLFFAERLMNPVLWEKTVSFHRAFGGAYPKKLPRLMETTESNKHHSCEWCHEWDTCMVKVLSIDPEICHLDDNCLNVLKDWSHSTGYFLTHRLIQWQLLAALNCGNLLPRNYSKSICLEIFKESVAIANAGFPKNLRDLFMEQVVVCSVEGYSDFLQKSWIDTVAEWQLDSGCFANINGRRTKRSVRQMPLGCESHSTGLAAAVYAVYLRYHMT